MTVGPDALAAAWDADAPAAWRAAAGLLRDAGAAEAVVHDAFVDAFRPEGSGDDAAALEATARRLAIEVLRAQGSLAHVARDIPDDADPSATMAAGDLVWSDPSATAPAATSVADASASLDGLGADDRVLLTLRYAQRRPVAEVAALVGRSEGATAVALHRARGRFTAAYAKRALARAGLPDACRAFRDQTIAQAALRPVSDGYAAHRVGCGWCRESEQCLRDRAAACAAAPLAGLSSGPPPAVRAAALAAVVALAAPQAASAGASVADAAPPAGSADAAPQAAPADAPAPAPVAPVPPSSAAPPIPATTGVAAVRHRVALAAAAIAAGALVLVVAAGVWFVAGPGRAPEPTPSPVAIATPTPVPTRVAPAGYVAVDVVACGTLASTGALDAGGAAVGSADVKADAMAGIDPAGYVLFAVAPLDGGVPSPGNGATTGTAAARRPQLYLAPRYWACVSVADPAAGFARVSLMPTIPVLLEKLAQAPIVATEHEGTFSCGAPVDDAACRAARAIHEDPSLVTMR